jgi:hypothetical protein
MQSPIERPIKPNKIRHKIRGHIYYPFLFFHRS